MPTVTALTAARMLAIEAASVVGGVVNGAGHLILTKHDLSTIDAGSVIGPQGIQGIQGPPDVNSVKITGDQNVDGLKTFLKKLSITLPAAGPSVQINKEAASMGGGSLTIGRTTPATQAQSVVFGNGLAYNYVIGRDANTDNLMIGIDGGGGFIERLRIDTGGGIFSTAQGSFFGVGSLGAAGAFVELDGTPSEAYIQAKGTPVNIPLILRAKGGSNIYLQTGLGGNLITVEASGDTHVYNTVAAEKLRLEATQGRFATFADSGGLMGATSAGASRYLYGLRPDISGNSDDLVTYTYTGSLRFFPLGTETVRMAQTVTYVSTGDMYVGPAAWAGGNTIRLRLQSLSTTAFLVGAENPVGGNAVLVLKAQGTSEVQLQGGDAGTFLRGGRNGGLAYLGFYGNSPITKPTVSGSRGGNAALASLVGQLGALGLITDSTTA